MNLNILAKERTELINELEKMKSIMTSENRSLTSEELSKVEELKENIETLNRNISFLEETQESVNVSENTNKTERSLNDKILDLSFGEVIELFETRATGLAMTTTNANGGSENTTALGSSAKSTFEDAILGSLTKTSGLFDAVKKINIPSALHQLPVSRKRVGKFVGVGELAEYTRNAAEIEPVVLEPVKLGTAISLSEELTRDYGYDIEGYIVGEVADALAETLDEIIIKGLTVGSRQIDGLESFNATYNSVGTDGSYGVAIENNTVSIDDLSKIYHTLPSKYRTNATWIISDGIAEALTNLKDANANPILIPNYHSAPFGSSYTLLGRPVIVNSFVSSDLETDGEKVVFFGDLHRALVCGIRNTLEISKSTEVGFLRDEIMLKAMARIDVKKAQAEAMAIGIIKV